jgi:uncharacterized protein (TIGR00295 family)
MTSYKKKDALALLKKYDVDKRVMDHLMAVHDYAMEIAANIDCDPDLVEAGSLLHDIGRTRSHGLDHALIGAEILRKEGVDERIVKIVERHIGAGLTPEEAVELGLPPGNYVPETIEEKIVCHADNLIGKTERISIHKAIETARNKWFPASVERLIKMHFEVFKPDDVVVNKNYAEIDTHKIDLILEDQDLLYKIKSEGSGCIISLYGRDSEKASKLLKKHMDEL